MNNPSGFANSPQASASTVPQATQAEILKKLFDYTPVMLVFVDRDGRVQMVNRGFEQTMGWSWQDICDHGGTILDQLYPDPQLRAQVERFLALSDGEWADFRACKRDGAFIELTCANVLLSDGSRIGIAHDITARKRAEEQLKAAGDQLRALAREEERTRIAREIHDELGSALTSLRWDLEGLDKALRHLDAEPQLAAIRTKLHSMLQLADTTFHSVRRIASELRPSLLDDLGLVAAMESQAQELQARTGIRFDVVCPAGAVNLSAQHATAVFRIFQEALTNIVRHSHATRADIVVELESDELVVLIRDNGQGIVPSERNGQGSLGFLGMRERARLMGGKVDIQSAAGQGTTVGIRVPV